MKFSVVVPAYNEGDFIGDCLESIASQDYEDFEVFIMDNQSTDDTALVAKTFVDNDKRFKLDTLTSHAPSACMGLNKAFNDYVTGEVGCWINADDSMLPGYFTSVLPYFFNPKVGFVRVGIRAWWADGSRSPEDMLPCHWGQLGDIATMNKVYPPSPFRMEMFYDVGGIDPNMIFYDWDFWIRCTLKGMYEKGWEYRSCYKPLVLRKIHGNQTPEQLHEYKGQIVKKYLRFKDEDGNIQEFKEW